MGKSPERVLESAFARYRLIRQIGEGGAGRVWAAVDGDGRQVAIKELAPDRVTEVRRKRFQNETRFCERNKHKNIVTVTDHGLSTVSGVSVPFYVMPLLSGSLRTVMASEAAQSDRLDYFRQILDGVEAAHLLGVNHRDLKPENILHDAKQRVVLVADFGIAHFSDEELFTAVETKSAERLANFQYAAPEQRVRKATVDLRADIYALGLIFNELFTGIVPHGSGYKTVASGSPELAWVDSVVERMIRQDSADRPASVAAVRQLISLSHDDFITQQRLSAITNTVVPEGDEDDPLALIPPKVVDFEWSQGILTIILDRHISNEWCQALLKMPTFRSIMGKEPAAFRFAGTRATIDCRDTSVQNVIDIFKGWLPAATQTYREQRELRRRQQAEQKRRQLQLEREDLERRQRLRGTIRL